MHTTKVACRHSFTSLGGGNEIGASLGLWKFPRVGSKTGHTNIAVDAGMRPITFEPENYGKLGPDMNGVAALDALLLTHAHFDHVAYAPKLGKDYPEMPVFATQVTKDIAALQWYESAKKMERLAENAALGKPAPIYTSKDVDRFLQSVRIIEPWTRFELPGDVTVLPLPAGHIIGAVSFYFEHGGRAGLQTGDVSFEDKRLIEGAMRKLGFRKKPDIIVSESTYLGDNTPEKEGMEEKFIGHVKKIFRRGGIACIPAFKIQKAEDIWDMLLRGGIPRSQIYVDGNAEPIFTLYARHTPMPMPNERQFIRKYWHRSELLAGGGPAVVIAFGGMLQEGSPAWRWLRMLSERPENGLIKVSYMDPCSPGGEVHARVKAGENRIRIGETEIELNASFHEVRFSSHASGKDLEAFMEHTDGARVFVHGPLERVSPYVSGNRHLNALFPENGEEVAW